jgi:magnesium-transporting ATPase (P-type)
LGYTDETEEWDIDCQKTLQCEENEILEVEMYCNCGRLIYGSIMIVTMLLMLCASYYYYTNKTSEPRQGQTAFMSNAYMLCFFCVNVGLTIAIAISPSSVIPQWYWIWTSVAITISTIIGCCCLHTSILCRNWSGEEEQKAQDKEVETGTIQLETQQPTAPPPNYSLFEKSSEVKRSPQGSNETAVEVTSET